MSRRKDLRKQLDAYTPETPADAASLVRIRELVAKAEDPFDRRVRDHVTAAAVIARPDASSFLLVHHRRLDRWLQPGGHVEPEDATVLDAARREAREETGVSALEVANGGRILDLDVHEIPRFPGKPPHVHYDVRFLFTAEPSAPIMFEADEVRDARWFTRREIDGIETDESLLRVLRKAARSLREER
jgi:8-oxo-dGTP pyrophosphatase MutT (NUDIX family)